MFILLDSRTSKDKSLLVCQKVLLVLQIYKHL